MRGLCVIAMVLGLLIGAAPARAGTVAFETRDVEGVPYGTLTFTAAPGERNDVTIEGARPIVRDDGAPIQVGEGCVLAPDGSARCGESLVLRGFTATIRAGDGNDRVRTDNGFAYTYLEDGDDQFEGAGPAFGGPGADELRRRGELGRLSGESGDDLLVGGPGNDDLEGGGGADRIEAHGGDDRIQPETIADETPGRDVVDAGPGVDEVSYIGRDEPQYIELGTPRTDRPAEADLLRGVENAEGGDGDDRIFGDDGPNRLNGLAGSDTVDAAGGADRIDGGFSHDPEVRDVLVGGPGPDLIDPSVRSSVDGGPGDDVIGGQGGPADVRCGSGRDVLVPVDGSALSSAGDCEEGAVLLGADRMGVLDLEGRVRRATRFPLRIRVRSRALRVDLP